MWLHHTTARGEVRPLPVPEHEDGRRRAAEVFLQPSSRADRMLDRLAVDEIETDIAYALSHRGEIDVGVAGEDRCRVL